MSSDTASLLVSLATPTQKSCRCYLYLAEEEEEEEGEESPDSQQRYMFLSSFPLFIFSFERAFQGQGSNACIWKNVQFPRNSSCMS